MKTQSLLYTKINSLPEQLQQEALDFIEFLMKKWETGKQFPSHPGKKIMQKKVHPQPGCMKGTFVMHPDFDEPLDDFKEYM